MVGVTDKWINWKILSRKYLPLLVLILDVTMSSGRFFCDKVQRLSPGSKDTDTETREPTSPRSSIRHIPTGIVPQDLCQLRSGFSFVRSYSSPRLTCLPARLWDGGAAGTLRDCRRPQTGPQTASTSFTF